MIFTAYIENMKPIVIKLTEKQIILLDELKKEKGFPRTYFIRQAINEYLRKTEKYTELMEKEYNLA